jgi:tRNA threonylcarbamoyladenosine biosynthesis protein TsaE
MEIYVKSEQELRSFGVRLGATLEGGEVIELVGDVGAGKTTLTGAIALGMGITDTISSPSYTLSQLYEAPHGLRLAHYDFYRLDDPGILARELEDVLADQRTVVVIEWGGIVEQVLPIDCLHIRIMPTTETARQLTLTAGGNTSQALLRKLS